MVVPGGLLQTRGYPERYVCRLDSKGLVGERDASRDEYLGYDGWEAMTLR